MDFDWLEWPNRINNILKLCTSIWFDWFRNVHSASFWFTEKLTYSWAFTFQITLAYKNICYCMCKCIFFLKWLFPPQTGGCTSCLTWPWHLELTCETDLCSNGPKIYFHLTLLPTCSNVQPPKLLTFPLSRPLLLKARSFSDRTQQGLFLSPCWRQLPKHAGCSDEHYNYDVQLMRCHWPHNTHRRSAGEQVPCRFMTLSENFHPLRTLMPQRAESPACDDWTHSLLHDKTACGRDTVWM